ncbi:FadR/GntR family transcriptional regulator [Enemella dayhoffiae]|uniref:FadR/GntR family transcriptional regulator n=1 Tax=Enemella dayhoffiae TaxID=2016507 RepID=UPI001595434A|nr:GntR family transcriptional regulator [Enemella dayhoffiae]
MTLSQVPDRVRIPKTAEVVARAIRTQILRGELREGESLPSESELMTQFGVSRPSLREAFRILESERLIEVRRGSRGGALVTHPDVSVAARYLGLLMQLDAVELRDVYDARTLLEPLGFRLLARQPDRAETADRLEALLAELTPELAQEDQSRIYVSFFEELFRSSRNKTLALVYGALSEVLRQELANAFDGGRDRGKSNEPHRSLGRALDRVRAGDEDGAADYWRHQLVHVAGQVHGRHGDKTLVDMTTQQ